MSKDTAGSGTKEQRRRATRKKAKQKKLIIISVCAIVAVALVVVALISTDRQGGTETFSAGGQIVQLLDDGRFSASLAHNVRKTGTYTRIDDGDSVIIAFTTDGIVETGWIMDDVLIIPEEWDDLCNHGRILPRR